MENKAISKMNKKELYQKCQEQQQEIQKMKLFEDNRDELHKAISISLNLKRLIFLLR